MRKITLSIVLIILASPLFAQLTIGANTSMKVQGQLIVKGAVNNQSSTAQFSTAEVVLSGADQALVTSAPVVLQSLTVDGGGTKTIQGNWEVNNTLNLTSGVVQIAPNAKLTYSGPNTIEGSNASYINGYFFNKGSGDLFFPIGTATTYAPVKVLGAASGEYGIRVVAGDPALALPTGVSDQFTGHYWEMNAAPNATVALSLNGAQTYLGASAPVVLEAPAAGGIATSLSGVFAPDFVTSAQSASQPILALARIPEFTLVIHDMITPFTVDEKNDRLFVENIDLTASNNVRLIDRWGVVVAEWDNYNNDIAEDFQRFSPGNYVCIVEYTAPGATEKSVAKGMVTILKAK